MAEDCSPLSKGAKRQCLIDSHHPQAQPHPDKINLYVCGLLTWGRGVAWRFNIFGFIFVPEAVLENIVTVSTVPTSKLADIRQCWRTRGTWELPPT